VKLKITILAVLCILIYSPLTLATSQSQYETIFYTGGDSFEEVLKQALAANPKDVEKIIAAAIATNPAEVERRSQVAGNSAPYIRVISVSLVCCRIEKIIINNKSLHVTLYIF